MTFKQPMYSKHAYISYHIPAHVYKYYHFNITGKDTKDVQNLNNSSN